MVATLLLLPLAAVIYYFYSLIASLRRNIALAKGSGLPYYVAPPYTAVARLFRVLWMPLFKSLPRKYWQDVMPILQPDWQYKSNYQVFAKLGEAFWLATPHQLLLYTCNAEVIHQVTAKREAFPKPLDSYKILAMYGNNVVTTEGASWRLHRKVTSASFNERNAALTFAESIRQTAGMVSQWLGPDGKGNKTIKSVEHDANNLTLHIIGYVGFGLRFLWPGQRLPADTDPKFEKYAALEPPAGHEMTFKAALEKTLDKIILLLILPRWLLRILPFESTKTAIKAETDFVKYMNEFLQDKVEDVQKGEADMGMDLMGQLVSTSYGEKQAGGTGSGKAGKLPTLTDQEIVGNAFVMFVAGHETTANTVHFTLLELATNPAAQRALQRDVDRIFGASDPRDWDYESSITALQDSMVGASLNESLRKMPPVVNVPKRVNAQAQAITVDGERHVLPRESDVRLSIVAAHRNPRYWPTQPSKITGAPQDIDDYVPERWFRAAEVKSPQAPVEGADTEDYGGYAGPDTSARLFRPPRGAYLPFSDGARSCLGRRIAQVELIATLSFIFQKYTVELAVDEWASDAEVEAMDRKQRIAVYRKAQAKSRETLQSATSFLTLKFHGGMFVPIRLVPREDARFVDFIDL